MGSLKGLSLNNGAVLLAAVAIVIIGIVLVPDQTVVIAGLGTLVATQLLQMMQQSQAAQRQEAIAMSAATEVRGVKAQVALEADKTQTTAAKVHAIAETVDATYKLSNSAHGTALQAVMIGLQRIADITHDLADQKAFEAARDAYDKHQAGQALVDSAHQAPGKASLVGDKPVEVISLLPAALDQIVEAVGPPPTSPPGTDPNN